MKPSNASRWSGLRALRARRDTGTLESSLKRVDGFRPLRRQPDAMHRRSCPHACATVGEISDTLRKVFGEYQETVVI